VLSHETLPEDLFFLQLILNFAVSYVAQSQHYVTESPDACTFFFDSYQSTVDFWTRITTLPTSGNNAAYYA
jgi:hypothetical protein